MYAEQLPPPPLPDYTGASCSDPSTLTPLHISVYAMAAVPSH
jgi:hypothetical protein